MPRLFFEVAPRLRWWMLLLAFLPCVPGLTFLVAAWIREPRGSIDNERAAQQAHGLYKAGAVAVGAGILLGTVVMWNVIRERTDKDEEDGI